MLEVKNVSYQRDEKVLFTNLSFSVASGQCWHIQGDNGVGKTTLLRLLCGLATPTAGEIEWVGYPLSQYLKEYYRCLVYMGHADGLKLDLSVNENLRLMCALYPSIPHSFEDVLARVGLEGVGHQLCHTLSAGQRRRVAWARLLLRQGVIWILDEPFTAIDAKGVDRLKRLLQEHLIGGGHLVLTSHQPISIAGVQTHILSL